MANFRIISRGTSKNTVFMPQQKKSFLSGWEDCGVYVKTREEAEEQINKKIEAEAIRRDRKSNKKVLKIA